MFLGSIQLRVDDRGRLKLPAEVQRMLEEKQKFYITSEDGKWAQLYPIKEWERKMSWVMKAPAGDPSRKRFEKWTSYYGGEAEMDSSGRVMLPVRLRTQLRLMNEDVSLVGRLLKAKSEGYPGILELINDEVFGADIHSDPLTDQDQTNLSKYED